MHLTLAFLASVLILMFTRDRTATQMQVTEAVMPETRNFCSSDGDRLRGETAALVHSICGTARIVGQGSRRGKAERSTVRYISLPSWLFFSPSKRT